MDEHRARQEMVERQLVARGIDDERVLDAFRTVPRHRFVPLSHRGRAHEDRPLPLDDGQTISQPYVVALTAQALAPGPDERVLDVGTGSGYAAAILARLAGEVHTIERLPALAERARVVLSERAVDNVEVHVGDGAEGLPAHAPFDAIAVAAAAPSVPDALLDQLAPGGRLVLPLGEHDGSQRLVLLRRDAEGTITEEHLGDVRFVPLVVGPSSGEG